MADAHHPGDSPGLLLWRATLRWQRAIVERLQPLGLTHVQFVLLASTWWLTEVAGEKPNQRRIAEQAGTDRMMTSQVLRTLEAKGLVERALDPRDSRARHVAVTTAGAELAVHAIRVVEATDAGFFAAVKDQRTLIAVLRALAE